MGPDTNTTFEVIITPVGTIENIIKQFSVSPSEIEVMWESVDGYAPPFYKGKVLPISGSLISYILIKEISKKIQPRIKHKPPIGVTGPKTGVNASIFNK